jgi:dihydrofolate reductase
MGKLIISSLVSLDGGQHAPQSWAGEYFDEEAVAKSMARLEHCDAMLMGRNAYQYLAPSWSQASGPYLDRINKMRKYVFSSTLRSAEWNNSEIISGDVVAETTRLKQDSTGDLVMYGCGRLGQTLLEHDLVDVLNLWIHPVILGTGESLLHEGQRKELQLDSVERRSSGVVSLTYVRKE